MSETQKKQYLDLYMLQQVKIDRLRELMMKNPSGRARYADKIRSCEQLRDKIESEIESVDGAILSEILGQKYLCGKSLEETADRLNYSKRQIERLHNKAIEKFRVNPLQKAEK